MYVIHLKFILIYSDKVCRHVDVVIEKNNIYNILQQYDISLFTGIIFV